MDAASSSVVFGLGQALPSVGGWMFWSPNLKGNPSAPCYGPRPCGGFPTSVGAEPRNCPGVAQAPRPRGARHPPRDCGGA